MTEDGFLAAGGVQTTGKSSPLAQRWAESMTRNYEALSRKLPIFAELRNCMDLAVVASLILKHRLDERAGYAMPLLMDPKQVAVPETFAPPRTVDSQASFVKVGRNWVVSRTPEASSWTAGTPSRPWNNRTTSAKPVAMRRAGRRRAAGGGIDPASAR